MTTEKNKTPGTCKECGKLFTGNNQKAYCCDKCREHRATPLVPGNCKHCGAEFLGQVGKAFCSKQCSGKFMAARPRPLIDNTCVHCGVAFQSARHRDYCSDLCYQRHYMAEHPVKRKPIPETVGTCKQCGKEFSGNKGKLFCNPSCRNLFYDPPLPVIERQCEFCQVKFNSSNPAKRCCGRQCCLLMNRRRKRGPCAILRTRTPQHQGKCQQCGAEFVGRADKKFCCTTCYNKHRWQIGKS